MTQNNNTPRATLWPWWLSVVAATVTYCLLRFVFPELSTENEQLNTFFSLAPDLAPVLTIPLLLLAAKQLYDNSSPEEDVPPQDEHHNE